MTHNKESFTREYCRCKNIPYRFKNEALFINGKQVLFSIYNHSYIEILKIIDDFCLYDKTFDKFISVK